MSRPFLSAKRMETKEQVRVPPKGGIFLIERRKYPRIAVEIPFDYSPVESEGERGFRGIVEDASEGGLLV